MLCSWDKVHPLDGPPNTGRKYDESRTRFLYSLPCDPTSQGGEGGGGGGAILTRESITKIQDSPNAQQEQHLITTTQTTVRSVRSLSASLFYSGALVFKLAAMTTKLQYTQEEEEEAVLPYKSITDEAPPKSIKHNTDHIITG